jgi:hypothetical protein
VYKKALLLTYVKSILETRKERRNKIYKDGRKRNVGTKERIQGRKKERKKERVV